MSSIKVLCVNDPAVYAYTEDSITGITKKWENENEYKVLIDIVDWNEYKSTLDKALTTNFNNYDIVMAPSFWIPNLAANNKVIPFEEYLTADYNIKDIFPSILDEISYRGKKIGVPSFSDGHIIFYRKDKLKLDRIETIESLIQKIDGIKENKRVLAIKASPYEIFLDFIPFMWDYGSELYNNEKLVFNNEKTLSALKQYMCLKKYCPQDIAQYGNDEVREAIQKGEVYVGISWSGQAAAIMEKEKNLYRDKIGFSTYEYPCNTTWTFLVSKFTHVPVKCFDFLKFITNNKNDLMSGRISGSPVRISSYQNKEEREKNPWYEANYEMLNKARRIPAIEKWTEVSDHLYEYVHKAFTEKLKPEEALSKCYEKIKNK
ncbi:extracellular solute-binding protein [Clostridium ganghwense]|uniref:Extracellular solute-binding protein n=1 Tax=Clostridium ganghwense TaxID=312089 RepID=A0ABT4CMC5_9CLOT|nr:extracellular solute-binding protein [Clostridium ganghwense]MCY6369149.1 extracellular solute-binding protein [Clostridium ganghwense]